MYKFLFSVFLLAALSFGAIAANYPCSKSKGGVSHCNGSTFVCNDGSTSKSKRNCAAERGNKASSKPSAEDKGSNKNNQRK